MKIIKFYLLSLMLFFAFLTGTSFAQEEEYDPRPEDFGRTWQDLPVIPELSEHARDILYAGIMNGHDTHAFAKVGDCDTSTSWYLTEYDHGMPYYDLGEYSYLSPVIEYFQGSFGRYSLAATPGFSAASVLSTYWTNYQFCDYEELPLLCEYRLTNPLFVLISLGTNDGYNPPAFKDNMRAIIDATLAESRLPILMLKADNVEGNFSINQDIADLGEEYDIPVWNFWRLVQDLPNHGLQEDGIHLTFYSSYFSDPRTFETAWAYRNLSALQLLEMMMNEIEALQGSQRF